MAEPDPTRTEVAFDDGDLREIALRIGERFARPVHRLGDE